MSALCQKRTLRNAAKRNLFDHLVGQQLHRFGDRKTESLGRLHIDYKFNLGGLLDVR